MYRQAPKIYLPLYYENIVLLVLLQKAVMNNWKMLECHLQYYYYNVLQE